MPIPNERTAMPHRARLFRLLFGGLIAVLIGGSAFFVSRPSDSKDSEAKRSFFINRRMSQDVTLNFQAVQLESFPKGHWMLGYTVYLPVLPFPKEEGLERPFTPFLPLLFLPNSSWHKPEISTALHVRFEGMIAGSGLYPTPKVLNLPPEQVNSGTPFTILMDFVDIDFTRSPSSGECPPPTLSLIP